MMDFKLKGAQIIKKLTTKNGLVGDYDYKHLFKPNLPFMKKSSSIQPFFGLNSEMPIVLGMLLGFQHSLSMLAGVVTPPIIIASSAHLDSENSQYLVSASLIISGLLSLIQITRFHIMGTKYYIGTGLVSVVGTSFATITIVEKAIPMMYKTGQCPMSEDGKFLPCPDGYGAILGTGCICALLEMVCSFIPPRFLQKIFPNIVTGPVVLLIGVHLIGTGFKDWLGGSGCSSGATLCPSNNAPHPLSFGSAEFIGLGFLVFATIILCEKFGSPIMKSCAVIIGLLTGCIVAAACNYFDDSTIKKSPAVTFLWVHTFKLSIYGPAVLPMLATYIVLMMEAIGDITATCDVSRLETDGEIYDSRIQGGVLADGLNGMLSCLGTMTPVSTFAQNNGVISITKCANRRAGYWCCVFLIIMGVFSKISAALISIPKAVLGGMTTFLFTSVTVSGISIISSIQFTRRNRFILTCSLLLGLGSTLVEGWFSNVFKYEGDNKSLDGFLNAIVLVLETGFAITGFVGIFLNLFIKEEEEEEVSFVEGEEHELNDSVGTSQDVKKGDIDMKVT